MGFPLANHNRADLSPPLPPSQTRTPNLFFEDHPIAVHNQATTANQRLSALGEVAHNLGSVRVRLCSPFLLLTGDNGPTVFLIKALQMNWRLIPFISIVLSALQTTAKPKPSTSGVNAAQTATMGTPKPGGCDKKMSWDPVHPDGSQEMEISELSDRLGLYNIVFYSELTDQTKSLQRTECNGFQDGILSWTTNFLLASLKGYEKEVKSYSHVRWMDTQPRKISDLKSIDASWFWTMEKAKEPLTCVLAYDIYTSKTPQCPDESDACARAFLKIWLASLGGTKPRGEKKSKSPIVLNKGSSKYEFDLWVEPGRVVYYTLVPPHEDVKYDSFDADLLIALQKIETYGFKYQEVNLNYIAAGTRTYNGGVNIISKTFTLAIS